MLRNCFPCAEVNLSSNMDKNPIRIPFTQHLDPLPRKLPLEVRLAAVGHVPEKTERVQTTFATVNFSLILRGRGDYRWRGVTHAVEAPAVLTQWPGARMDYGPQGTWRELFLIYPGDTEARFRGMGMLNDERPWWPVATAGPFLEAVEELMRVHLRKRPADDIDRLDRLAERAVAESLLGAAAVSASPAERIVLDLRERVDRQPPGSVDPEAQALRQGLSRSHFRRLWQHLVGPPPARYAAERRLRVAANRLAEGDDTVTAIAADLGFPDPLYFSRRFKAFLGSSPGAYRKRYRETLRRLG